MWEKRLPDNSSKTFLQWANRLPRWRDPFFWVSLGPLLACLVALVYGLVALPVPKVVSLLLLVIAGLALIQFAERWGIHYENFAVTQEGLARVFPLREVPGPLRLFPLLQALATRPRLLPWSAVLDVRRRSKHLVLLLSGGRKVEVALDPLRVLRGQQVLDVGRSRGGGKTISREEAVVLIERSIRRALETGRDQP